MGALDANDFPNFSLILPPSGKIEKHNDKMMMLFKYGDYIGVENENYDTARLGFEIEAFSLWQSTNVDKKSYSKREAQIITLCGEFEENFKTLEQNFQPPFVTKSSPEA